MGSDEGKVYTWPEFAKKYCPNRKAAMFHCITITILISLIKVYEIAIKIKLWGLQRDDITEWPSAFDMKWSIPWAGLILLVQDRSGDFCYPFFYKYSKTPDAPEAER